MRVFEYPLVMSGSRFRFKDFGSGVVVDGRDWYVKLYLTVDVEAPHDDVTVCVSFHPPRFPMTTRSGRKVLP